MPTFLKQDSEISISDRILINNALHLALDIDGISDILVLAVQKLSGTNSNFLGEISYLDIL